MTADEARGRIRSLRQAPFTVEQARTHLMRLVILGHDTYVYKSLGGTWNVWLMNARYPLAEWEQRYA